MVMQETDVTHRLKLKEGDFIEATVEGIDTDSLWLDPSPWSNVETMVLDEVSENASISPGSEIYAEVAKIAGTTASLIQRRGVYRRNHLPGDDLRVQTVEQVSSAVSRGQLDSLRNLETIYVIGVAAGADVTATIAKIRNGTAYAYPTTTHDPGLVADREVKVETTAGNQEAVVIGATGDSSKKDQAVEGIPVELLDPAPITGTVTASMTAETADERVAKIDKNEIELPKVGETVEKTVQKNHTKITISVQDGENSIEVELDHGCPCDGSAVLELIEKEDWYYKGKIKRYTNPQIKPGRGYNATVLEEGNRARVEGTTIRLTHEISKTGNATVRITEISDEIYGRIDSDIDKGVFTNIERSDKADIDMSDLSKF